MNTENNSSEATLTDEQLKIVKGQQDDLDAMYAAGNKQPMTIGKSTASFESAAVMPPHFIRAPISEPRHLAGLVEIGKDESGSKTTFIGELGKKLLENFLGQNQVAWRKMQADEREMAETKGRFKAFTEAVAQSNNRLATIIQDVDNSSDADIPLTLWKNHLSHGGSMLSLLCRPESAPIFGAWIIQQHSKEIKALAQAEHDELLNLFADFKREKQSVLKSLGLI